MYEGISKSNERVSLGTQGTYGSNWESGKDLLFGTIALF